MGSIQLIKQRNGSYLPAYLHDKDISDQIGVGELIKCDFYQSRNHKMHNKFFKLITIVFENQSEFTLKKDLRKDLLIKAGYFFEENSVKYAKSLNFESMCNTDFTNMFNKVLDVIYIDFGINKNSLIEEVHRYIQTNK